MEEYIEKLSSVTGHKERCPCYICRARKNKDEILKYCTCIRCAPEYFHACPNTFDLMMQEKGDPDEIHNNK